MTFRLKRTLLTVVSGSALAMAPLAFATVVAPAASQAEPCHDAPAELGEQDQPCGTPPVAAGQGLNCPDGTIVDTKNAKCVSLTAGISKQLRALPAPPGLSGFGGGGGGVGGLGKIPSLGTVNLPDVVLPSLGLGLVPDFSVNLRPEFPSFNPFG